MIRSRTPLLEPLTERSNRRRWQMAALCFVLLCGVLGVKSALRDWPSGTLDERYSTSPRDMVLDEDTGWVLQGVERAPRLADTVKWWSGPWIQEPHRIFYRPLTSLAWWLEYQVLGRYSLQSFMTLHLLFHLSFICVAWGFLGSLLNYRTATLAMALHGTFAIDYFGLPIAAPALFNWKDSADIWMSIAYLSACWSFLWFLRGRGVLWLVATGALAVVAIGFKEMAYTLPLALLLVAWCEGRLRTHWRWVLPFFALVLIAFLFRWWALEGYGTRIGSNNSWFYRWIIGNIGGAVATPVFHGNALSLALALFGWAAIAGLVAKQTKRAWMLAVVGIVALIVTELTFSIYQGDVFLRLVLIDPWLAAIPAMLYLWLVWRFLQNRWRGQIFGYGWVLITFLPLTTAPLPGRGDYLVSLGWSLWLACAVIDCFALGRRWIEEKLPNAPGLSPRLSIPADFA